MTVPAEGKLHGQTILEPRAHLQHKRAEQHDAEPGMRGVHVPVTADVDREYSYANARHRQERRARDLQQPMLRESDGPTETRRTVRTQPLWARANRPTSTAAGAMMSHANAPRAA